MRSDETVNICFHGIGTPGRALEPGEDRYWIDADQYVRILDEVSSWPRVGLSFDDGNASDLELGLEPLVERGLTATFFVLAGRLGADGSLTADGVRELSERGMQIGTHGMDHRPWPQTTSDELGRELVEARALLADMTGSAIEVAALPLGRYDRRVLRELRALGYRRVYSSDRRVARAGSWLQPRFSVRNDDTPERLRDAVTASREVVPRVRAATVGLLKRLR